MQNLADRHTILDLPKLTNLESLIQGYIFNCQCEAKSPTTIDTYSRLLRLFDWYCKSNSYPSPQQLTAMHVRSFLMYVGSERDRWGNTSLSSRHPAKSGTVNHYYRVLRVFFGWLVEESLIAENPINRIKAPKVERKVVKALTSKETELLLQTCSGRSRVDVRDRAILSLFLDCGLRISELAGLSLDDLDLNNASLLIHGKGGKQRIVRIGAKAQKALWRYTLVRGESDHLFINRGGEPLGVYGVRALITRLGERAGVKVHPHKLRHTFAVSFLRAGGDVFSLQYLLGHSTLQMTQRYLQSLNADDAANAHRKFSPLDNLGKV